MLAQKVRPTTNLGYFRTVELNSSYITSAKQAEQLPDFPFPEVAFVGRSNVGKSSLMNALLDRRGLARASNTPGRTQMVNFFSVQKGEKEMILADLPGYGYSAIGKDARRHWEDLMAAYLNRRGISAFLFLIDSRRATPLLDDDLELLASLSRSKSKGGVTVVLTKSDKMSQGELAKTVKAVTDELKKAKIKTKEILAVSTLKKKGLAELKTIVFQPLD